MRKIGMAASAHDDEGMGHNSHRHHLPHPKTLLKPAYPKNGGEPTSPRFDGHRRQSWCVWSFFFKRHTSVVVAFFVCSKCVRVGSRCI